MFYDMKRRLTDITPILSQQVEGVINFYNDVEGTSFGTIVKMDPCSRIIYVNSGKDLSPYSGDWKATAREMLSMGISPKQFYPAHPLDQVYSGYHLENTDSVGIDFSPLATLITQFHYSINSIEDNSHALAKQNVNRWINKSCCKVKDNSVFIETNEACIGRSQSDNVYGSALLYYNIWPELADFLYAMGVRPITGTDSIQACVIPNFNQAALSRDIFDKYKYVGTVLSPNMKRTVTVYLSKYHRLLIVDPYVYYGLTQQTSGPFRNHGKGLVSYATMHMYIQPANKRYVADREDGIFWSPDILNRGDDGDMLILEESDGVEINTNDYDPEEAGGTGLRTFTFGKKVRDLTRKIIEDGDRIYNPHFSHRPRRIPPLFRDNVDFNGAVASITEYIMDMTIADIIADRGSLLYYLDTVVETYGDAKNLYLRILEGRTYHKAMQLLFLGGHERTSFGQSLLAYCLGRSYDRNEMLRPLHKSYGYGLKDMLNEALHKPGHRLWQYRDALASVPDTEDPSSREYGQHMVSAYTANLVTGPDRSITVIYNHYFRHHIAERSFVADLRHGHKSVRKYTMNYDDLAVLIELTANKHFFTNRTAPRIHKELTDREPKTSAQILKLKLHPYCKVKVLTDLMYECLDYVVQNELLLTDDYEHDSNLNPMQFEDVIDSSSHGYLKSMISVTGVYDTYLNIDLTLANVAQHLAVNDGVKPDLLQNFDVFVISVLKTCISELYGRSPTPTYVVRLPEDSPHNTFRTEFVGIPNNDKIIRPHKIKYLDKRLSDRRYASFTSNSIFAEKAS